MKKDNCVKSVVKQSDCSCRVEFCFDEPSQAYLSSYAHVEAHMLDKAFFWGDYLSVLCLNTDSSQVGVTALVEQQYSTRPFGNRKLSFAICTSSLEKKLLFMTSTYYGPNDDNWVKV
jgi:hypothetical protein